MKPKLSLALVVCLAALGLAAGLFAFPARADNSYGAHSVADLQALGYRVGLRVDLSISQCGFLYVLDGGGVTFPDLHEPVIENNVDPNHPDPGCPATPPAVIQQRIDDLLAAYPPVPQTTTAAADTTPAPAPAPAAPGAPAGTPATPGGTTTVTVTVTDPLVQAQLDALNAKLDALANPTVDARLSALEQRQQVNDARIATLELKAGIIVPEAKNEPPFTNPV